MQAIVAAKDVPQAGITFGFAVVAYHILHNIAATHHYNQGFCPGYSRIKKITVAKLRCPRIHGHNNGGKLTSLAFMHCDRISQLKIA